jgi:hypothetical protein
MVFVVLLCAQMPPQKALATEAQVAELMSMLREQKQLNIERDQREVDRQAAAKQREEQLLERIGHLSEGQAALAKNQALHLEKGDASNASAAAQPGRKRTAPAKSDLRLKKAIKTGFDESVCASADALVLAVHSPHHVHVCA